MPTTRCDVRANGDLSRKRVSYMMHCVFSFLREVMRAKKRQPLYSGHAPRNTSAHRVCLARRIAAQHAEMHAENGIALLALLRKLAASGHPHLWHCMYSLFQKRGKGTSSTKERRSKRRHRCTRCQRRRSGSIKTLPAPFHQPLYSADWRRCICALKGPLFMSGACPRWQLCRPRNSIA